MTQKALLGHWGFCYFTEGPTGSRAAEKTRRTNVPWTGGVHIVPS